jgi:hypothetical protein
MSGLERVVHGRKSLLRLRRVVWFVWFGLPHVLMRYPFFGNVIVGEAWVSYTATLLLFSSQASLLRLSFTFPHFLPLSQIREHGSPPFSTSASWTRANHRSRLARSRAQSARSPITPRKLASSLRHRADATPSAHIRPCFPVALSTCGPASAHAGSAAHLPGRTLLELRVVVTPNSS